MEEIFIQDNTIRDGFQQVGIKKDLLTTTDALSKINKSNINSIEVGMCVNDFDLHIMKKKLSFLSNDTKAVVLTRLKEHDITQVINLNKTHKNVILKLLIPVSDLHIEKKLGKDKEEYLDEVIKLLNICKHHNLQFDICLEDATRADLTYLFKVMDICDNYRVGFVTIADTVGFCTPNEYGELIKKITMKGYSFKLSVHCHNDLGLATANTVAGVINGAKQVECTFLGIGERAGNASLDEVCYILRNKFNFKLSATDKNIYETSKYIEKLIELDVHATKPIIGRNVFKHESGIHQHGMMINKSMYQYIDPEYLGLDIDVNVNISHLSSRKIIKSAIHKKIGKIEHCNELIEFFKNSSKIIGTVSIEAANELYLYSQMVK